MTIYARSDVMSVTHPVTGETFEREVARKATKNAPAEYADEFAIDSDPDHEQSLLETFPDQYARRADRVPHTPDELAGMGQHEQSAAVAARERAAAEAGVLAETRGRVNRAFRRAP